MKNGYDTRHLYLKPRLLASSYFYMHHATPD